MSIPTDDDVVRSQFEPGADAIDDRLEALAAAHDAGLRTCAVIQPMLPMNVERLVARLAPFVRAVRIDRMHRMDRARPLYEAAGRMDAADDAFFERTERDLRSAFAAKGIATDDRDDLSAALGLHASWW
jgi:DNA repair photolyase